MSYVYTGPWDVIKQPQFVEETTPGETPNNAVFKHTGPLIELSESIEPGSIEHVQVGDRDIHSMIQTGTSYTMDISYAPIDEDLIQYAVNLPGVGTKNIGKTLTFLKSQLVDDVEHFTLYKGSVADSIDVNITSDSAVEIAIAYICQNITTPATTHGLGGTPTFHTGGIAGSPWTNITPGPDPLTFNGQATDTNAFSMSCSLSPEIIKPNGMIDPKAILPTRRTVEWEFTTWYKDTLLISDTRTLTPRAMLYNLSDDKRLKFVDAYPTSITMSDSASATEHKTLTVSGRAQSVEVEDY